MRIFESPAQLHDAIGEHLGHSGWHLIDQARVNAFAEVTGDHQWIHTDPQRAAAGPFGTTIAHGYLTLSLLPLLCAEIYQVQGVRMGVNYGLNRVRFPSPVPTGSRVRAGLRVIAAEEVSAGALQVVSEVTVERDGGDKPSVVAESVSRYYL
jgi:acyl dehydratase